MWPEGQTVSFGRPLLRVVGAGLSGTPVSEIEPCVRRLLDEAPCIDLAALEEARQEGYRHGREDAARAFDSPRAFLKKCADAFQAETRCAGQRLDEAAVKLALEIAAKLLERELKDPAAAREVALNALKLVPHDDKVVLRIHPTTSLALKRLEGEAGESEFPPHVSLIVDHTVEPGGCIVQTPAENWDAQMSSRLALVARELGCDERSERMGQREIE